MRTRNPARLEYVLGFRWPRHGQSEECNERVRLSSGGIGVSTNSGGIVPNGHDRCRSWPNGLSET
ncbi:hypothetical protein P7H17_27040 [Paenibacillus larvae]|nr:hypothetical protein [Paenibacillus larvae]MDT2288989.1 hypothetical protein [Paenibacillus larvae]